MSKRWFTSDTHFDHKNILKYCKDTRPFSDVNEMNEAIIERHNSVVKAEDRVYFLGDIGFDAQTILHRIQRMNGEKILILGNHDKLMMKVHGRQKMLEYFSEIRDYMEITIGKRKVVMFHYPIFEWNSMQHGAIHLHGHTHGGVKVPGNAFDVGVDSVLIPGHLPGTPYSEDQIISLYDPNNIRKHHGD